MKKVMTIIASIIALMTLTAVAFAADDEMKDIGPAIWADETGTYTADGSGEIKFYPNTADIGPAIYADETGTYTADGSGEIKFYPNPQAIGPAIWADETGVYTSNTDGTITLVPQEPAFEMISVLCPSIWVYNHSAALNQTAHTGTDQAADIGAAIWSDGQYIYTAGANGAVSIIPCEPAIWVAPATASK